MYNTPRRPPPPVGLGLGLGLGECVVGVEVPRGDDGVLAGVFVVAGVLAAACSAVERVGFGLAGRRLTSGTVVPLMLGTLAALGTLGVGPSPRVNAINAAQATVSVTAVAIALGRGFDT